MLINSRMQRSLSFILLYVLDRCTLPGFDFDAIVHCVLLCVTEKNGTQKESAIRDVKAKMMKGQAME